VRTTSLYMITLEVIFFAILLPTFRSATPGVTTAQLAAAAKLARQPLHRHK
jgi:hypothetical protein